MLEAVDKDTIIGRAVLQMFEWEKYKKLRKTKTNF